MNLLQLTLKQMRQRALSTWLTLLSVFLGVGLATSVLILQRESAGLFTQTDYGYDILVGAKGSPMQLVLNTVYHVDKSPGNIPYIVYEALKNNRPLVKHAVPYAVGDTYKNYRVAGTLPTLFGFDEFTAEPLRGYDKTGRMLPDYQSPDIPEESRDPNKKVAASTFDIRQNKKFTLAAGRIFHPRKFEAVIGNEIPERTGLKLGDKFKVTHGGIEGDEHGEEWTVVGILDKTYTAEDRVLFIPLITFYAIPQHEKAMDLITGMLQGEDLSRFRNQPATGPATTRATTNPATTGPATAAATQPADPHAGHDHEQVYTFNPDGTIELRLPKDRWLLSAVLVRSRGTFTQQSLIYMFANSPSAAAVNPASVMREFFTTFLGPTTIILLVISILVTITAAVSILVSIYNAVSARAREIAIMRALGATRGKVLTLICTEAGLVGLVGGLIGILLGHGLGAIQSIAFEQRMGVGIDYLATDAREWIYLGGVVVLSVLAGLVPGLKAYRTPVATNLVAS